VAGSPYTPGTAAAGEAVGVGVTDKSPKAPLGVTDDGVDDLVDDGGDAVSDEEHAATRTAPARPINAFSAAVRVVAAILEFNTRLVKTKSLGLATFVGSFCLQRVFRQRW